MKHGIQKIIFSLIMFFVWPALANAATGDILYQNCASGTCTGAGSATGWVRTVETNGCYSGSCLKLVATSNPLPSGSVRYGAGNTSINTQSVNGKREVTVSFWIKFNKDSTAISGGNIKNIIPYIKDEVRYGAIISDAPVRDYYVGNIIGTFRPASWLWVLTNATNAAYAVPNGDGTYFANNYTAFEFEGKAPPGTTWKKFTVYMKTPSTPTARDGIYRIWYGNDLMLDFWNAGPKNIPTISELQRISFYPSSEATEPFEHWMDEMIIYEGYVPPSGAVDPVPIPPTPTDTTKPQVTTFTMTPTTLPTNTTLTANYSVTDNTALARVELWRAPFNITNCSDTVKTGCVWTKVTEANISGTSKSGTLTSSPSAAGTFFYGLHAVDTAGNIGYEPTPRKVTVSAPSPAPTPTATACHQLSALQGVPINFGAAYDVFNTNKLIINTDCGTSNVNVKVGDGAVGRYIYKYGYVLRNSAWQRVDLTPGGAVTGDWLLGQASANLPFTSTELAQNNYFITYTCTLVNNQWKCGCRDSTCGTPYWQLQTFKR